MRGHEVHPALAILLAVLIVFGVIATSFFAGYGLLLVLAALIQFLR